MPGEQQKELVMTARWEYAEEHRVLPCTGLIGGITPSGELRVDVYINLGASPEKLKVKIMRLEDENNEESFEEHVSQPEHPELRRVIQATLLIPREHVGDVAKFFNEQVESYESLGTFEAESRNI